MRKKVVSFLVIIFSLSLAGLARADDLPDSAYITGVTGHAQNYSLSCEARSAVDWMAFWGVSVSESDFLAGLPRTDNPDTGFVGNPNDGWGSIPPHSYGVHAEPVAALLRTYGFKAKVHRGASWDDLRTEIAAGRPVIVWIIGQMWNGKPIQYTASDGQTTTVAYYEHTMILIGYNPSTVTVVDAFSGQTLTFTKSAFVNSWGVLGNMAIFGRNPSPASASPASSKESQTTAAGTYTVQQGEYLTQLALRFGTSWQELAKLNDIAYPYIIYTGQVLKIPGAPSKPTSGKAASAVSPTPTPKIHHHYKIWLPLINRSPNVNIVLSTPPVELLYILAGRHGTDWYNLITWNHFQIPPELAPTQTTNYP